MFDYIGKFADVISIISAVVSFVMFLSTKSYYDKIKMIEDIEKINKCIDNIKGAKAICTEILKVLGNSRGYNLPKIIKEKFIQIKGEIQSIQNELPIKYQEIHNQIQYNSIMKYIDEIISGEIDCKNDDEFQFLQIKLDLIQNELNSKRDKIRNSKVK